MAAGLFGALGAIGDAGNQWADSRQMAHDEIVRRLAETDAQQLRAQNLQKGGLNLKAMQAPVAVGTPYVSNGKKVQDFQDPITGAVTSKDASGGVPETTQETMYRGLTGIGDSAEDARDAVTGKATGKKPKQYMGVEPDPSSPTGYSMVHRDESGKFLWKITAMAPRQGQQRQTDSTSIDAFGVPTHRSTRSGPVLPNAARLTLPENATYAPGSAPGGYTIGEDGSLTPNQPQGGQGGQGGSVASPAASGGQPGAAARGGVPPPGGGAALLQALAAAHPPATPQQAIVQRLAANKVPVRPATRPASAAPSATDGTVAALPQGQGYNIGPYKGLDDTGHIPARPGLNPQLVAAANRLFDDSDVAKLGVRGADLQAVTALASKYGWRQGSLTPAQQMQIHQVDNSLKALSDPKMLKLFDSTAGRLLMSTVSLDPTGEGGFAGLEAAAKRGVMSQQQTEYMNALTRLRGVIGGIRGFTGANNSNATADRLLAELPNFTNTKNSADAKDKLDKLRQEVEIIKRLGYFLPDGDPRLSGGGAAAPAQDNPLGLKLPTAGR